MREGNRSRVSGGASLHGPMRGMREQARPALDCVFSVISGRRITPATVPVCGHQRTRGSM